jgi:hypothetical protein
MKKSNAGIFAILFAASFVVNVFFYLGYIGTSKSTVKEDDPMEKARTTRSYDASKDSTCATTIEILKAHNWIAAVNASDIKFNNKSIFICAEAARAMVADRDFNGIWVRRGMDEDLAIHDIAWINYLSTATPANAYLLEWKSCICEPCCDTDSADFDASH